MLLRFTPARSKNVFSVHNALHNVKIGKVKIQDGPPEIEATPGRGLTRAERVSIAAFAENTR